MGLECGWGVFRLIRCQEGLRRRDKRFGMVEERWRRGTTDLDGGSQGCGEQALLLVLRRVRETSGVGSTAGAVVTAARALRPNTRRERTTRRRDVASRGAAWLSSKRGEVESLLLVGGTAASLSMFEKAWRVSAAVVQSLERDRGDVIEAAARNRDRGGWMALFVVKTRTIDGREAGGGVVGVWDQEARNVIRHVERCSFGMDAFWRGRGARRGRTND